MICGAKDCSYSPRLRRTVDNCEELPGWSGSRGAAVLVLGPATGDGRAMHASGSRYQWTHSGRDEERKNDS